MQYLKHLNKTFSPGMTGGKLGYIDQVLHLLNQLDIVDLVFQHHVSYIDQQKMKLILCCCRGPICTHYV
jgi:hypothetical protein